MSSKKVIFHPLERLDIIDVDGLQDLSHSAAESLAGAVLGVNVEGVAEPFTTVVVNNTLSTIQFYDFSFMGRMNDTDGNAKHKPAFVSKFRSLDLSNGDCVFLGYKSLTQTYYNTNGSLPPSPNDEAFNAELHGAYYPYIYIRPIVTETASASRRFWDAGSNTEVTDNVVTRTGVRHEFTLAIPADGTPVSATEFPWVRIAAINLWEVSGGVVSLSSAGVKPYMLADSMLGVAGNGRVAADIHSAVRAGGVSGAVAWIMAHVDAMKSGGTDDVAERPTVQRYELPKYSMSDLGYRLDELTSVVNALKLVESSTLILSVTFDGGLPTLTYSSSATNTFQITAALNYRYAREFIARTESVNIEAFTSTEWNTYFATDDYASQFLASIALVIPEAYRNKKYAISLEPLYSDRGGEFIESGSGAAADARTYWELKRGETWSLLPESPTNINACGYIGTVTRQTAASSTPITFNGLNIGLRGLTSVSDLQSATMRYDLKVTLSILNQ